MKSIIPPPFRIYLLRHAEAAPAARGQGDIERPLSRHGLIEAGAVAEQAADQAYKPNLILASPARRCRETVEVVCRALGGSIEVRYLDALYNAGPSAYLDMIASQVAESSVMLVGHNPTIEQTLEGLIGQEALEGALPLGYPTGGLAVIDARVASLSTPSGWVLSDFLTG
ncbi:SixA phosphatase family protein [Rhizobium sp. RAF56]|jgi:phosphohistidine phosphatase|uniref:SixA phosphatase family protein n=1 Tax=Rhizobium sp. RAF56 TaxID=3233062 RepID=UPI003F9B31F8